MRCKLFQTVQYTFMILAVIIFVYAWQRLQNEDEPFIKREDNFIRDYQQISSSIVVTKSERTTIKIEKSTFECNETGILSYKNYFANIS
jgi:hypothetical protein